jgi:hypothetical protein
MVRLMVEAVEVEVEVEAVGYFHFDLSRGL